MKQYGDLKNNKFRTQKIAYRALVEVKICPAALNRGSYVALAGRGMFVSKNSCLMSGHATTVIVSVDGFSRYLSSCIRAVE